MNTLLVYRVVSTAARHSHEYAMYLVPVWVESAHFILLAAAGFVVFLGGIALLVYMEEHRV